MIRLDCPGCGRGCEFADYLAGMTVICKSCGQRLPLKSAKQNSPPPATSITTAPSPVPEPANSAIQTEPTPSLAASVSELPDLPSIVKTQSGAPAWPEWAVEFAVSALRIGMLVKEIEGRLVARGLSPGDARGVVDHVLESGVREQTESIDASERREWVHRILSALLCGLCFALAYWFGGPRAVGGLTMWVMLPMACIWIPGFMSRTTDSVYAGAIRGFGWLLLLVIVGRVVVVLYLAAQAVR